LPPSQKVIRLHLSEFEVDSFYDNGMWMAIEVGDMLTSFDSPSELLGGGLATDQFGNLWPFLATPGWGHSGFEPPLEGGIPYTFWMQQTNAAGVYTLDMVVTPLPATLPLAAGGLVGLGLLARRARRGATATATAR